MRKYREGSYKLYVLRLYAAKFNHNPKQIQYRKTCQIMADGKSRMWKRPRQWLLRYATASLHTAHCYIHDVPELSFTPFIQK
jgi:hypothetical protein